jgi:uncharacterized membrane protein
MFRLSERSEVMMFDGSPEGSGSPPPPPAETPPPVAPPPVTPSGPAAETNSVMIVLSYLWLLCLVPLLMEKEDREVQWHAKHGLVLLIAEVAFWIVVTVITSVLGAITAGLGCLLSMITPLFGIAFLVIHILCIVKGLKGQRFLVPYVSEFADRF